MDSHSLATRLIDTLPFGQSGLFNPWRDNCAGDLPQNTPAAKALRLAQHLAVTPELILCGEASGYQGCVRSGIPFTSERLLIEGKIPRVGLSDGRLTTRSRPFSEPSATIVWKTLEHLSVAETTVLWNALPLHPHRPGVPLSNRTPSRTEISLGASAIRLLAESFPDAKIIAVGRKADSLLRDSGIVVTGALRHPANGGAKEFATGLEALLKSLR